MSWVMMRPDATVAEAVGLSTSPIPVHADRVDEIFGDDRVDLRALLDNLEVFAQTEPDSVERLTDTVVWLFETVVDEMLTDGNFELAENYALRGLSWAPRRVGLKARLGSAQHGLGQHSEATVHWLAAVSQARRVNECSPMLWLLTARALMEQNQLAAAATLLDDLAETKPVLPEFWELHELLRDRINARNLA